MNTAINIPAGYSTRQAANLLGVSAHEVSRLVRCQKLQATKTDAGIYVVDSNSLYELKAKKRSKGRLWNAATSWAALLILEGAGKVAQKEPKEESQKEPKEEPKKARLKDAKKESRKELEEIQLSYHQKRRLLIALKTISAEHLVFKIQKRASISHFSCSPSFAGELKESLILSGASYEHLDKFGLFVSSKTTAPLNAAVQSGIAAPQNTPTQQNTAIQLDTATQLDTIDGYTTKELESIVAKFHLVPDRAGKCTIRVPHDLPKALSGIKKLPLTVVAADLAGSVNTRERKCGLNYLQRKLDDYRKN